MDIIQNRINFIKEDKGRLYNASKEIFEILGLEINQTEESFKNDYYLKKCNFQTLREVKEIPEISWILSSALTLNSMESTDITETTLGLDEVAKSASQIAIDLLKSSELLPFDPILIYSNDDPDSSILMESSDGYDKLSTSFLFLENENQIPTKFNSTNKEISGLINNSINDRIKKLISKRNEMWGQLPKSRVEFFISNLSQSQKITINSIRDDNDIDEALNLLQKNYKDENKTKLKFPIETAREIENATKIILSKYPEDYFNFELSSIPKDLLIVLAAKEDEESGFELYASLCGNLITKIQSILNSLEKNKEFVKLNNKEKETFKKIFDDIVDEKEIREIFEDFSIKAEGKPDGQIISTIKSLIQKKLISQK